MPLSVDGILAAAVLTFAHTLGEFGVVLMVGGNLPGVTRTISIALYDEVQSLDLAAAHQTALMLLALSFAALSIVYALMRKPWAVAPLS
jgi:molybdate transport system permease protein